MVPTPIASTLRDLTTASANQAIRKPMAMRQSVLVRFAKVDEMVRTFLGMDSANYRLNH